MPYRNRIRLPIMFAKPQFPTERNSFRLANGVSKTLSVVIRNTYEGKTDQLPKDWHQKLVVALSHDEVNVENERLLSGVSLDGDYGIDWQDFLNYPIAGADFRVQVTPFNATNSNCQTCEDISQVVCEDDTTDEVWDEGTTNEFPDNLTANDSICCNPFTVTLVDWNTLYFSSVSITPDGILTATVIDPAPIVSNVYIATYRVTCADGSYDEADVYGNITGSDEDFCTPPGIITLVAVDSNSTHAFWDAIAPPTSFEWELFESSDLGTPIQSGTLPAGTSDYIITGLTPDVSYTWSLVADCSGGARTNLSQPRLRVFTISSFASEVCGKFVVTYLPNVNDAPQSISYMDCGGGIQNEVFSVASEREICMLITAGSEVPIYFVASSVDISLTYSSLCE